MIVFADGASQLLLLFMHTFVVWQSISICDIPVVACSFFRFRPRLCTAFGFSILHTSRRIFSLESSRDLNLWSNSRCLALRPHLWQFERNGAMVLKFCILVLPKRLKYSYYHIAWQLIRLAFYATFVVVGLSMANVVFVAWMLANNNFKYMWAFELLPLLACTLVYLCVCVYLFAERVSVFDPYKVVQTVRMNTYYRMLIICL